jgi:hypothetical protein
MKVGDRVRVMDDSYSSDAFRGKYGTVCNIAPNTSTSIGVEFDHDITYGHTCDGTAKKGTGRYFREQDLEAQSTKYLIEGFCGLFDTYEAAEARAKEEASDTGESTAIARVVAYAKPTTSIIVEQV